MDWISSTFYWYIIHLILGLTFFPLTRRLFGRFFPDHGYAFAKTMAILFLSYTVFILGLAKILPFTQFSLIFLILLFGIFNFILNKSQSANYSDKQSTYLIIFEEFLFLLALFFWAFVRGQEPSIRGLEKFMDFGFISSILRSKYFPPLDMWLSADQANPKGFFINYYYFGHLSGALLIKLSGIKSAVGYNLILASTFALTVIQSFSLTAGIIHQFQRRIQKIAQNTIELGKYIFFGLLGSFTVSLTGNLHTIYVFTKGYPNESPIPFWKIFSWYNPAKYWYPNATRFIPNTIHEFPSYSWVVADMHGHVFDIPFVLLTLAVLFIFFIKKNYYVIDKKNKHQQHQDIKLIVGKNINFSFSYSIDLPKLITTNYYLLTTVFIGFLTAVHYMTNAFDGPIYILLALVLLIYLFRFSKKFVSNALVLVGSFVVFAFPFSIHFKPFVTGIGVNCSPEFLTKIGKIGPFLFEKGNCQVSPIWMLLVLWGFFWINFAIFALIKYFNNKQAVKPRQTWLTQSSNETIDRFIFILFAFGTFLIIIPEFFYIKDIYPAHFRANTMFKLGYQAFIMMGIASTYVFYKIKLLDKLKSRILAVVFALFFFLIAIYPLFAIPSYYGQLDRQVELDGTKWFTDAVSSDGLIPEDLEIIEYLNSNIAGQPVILEAQGDSYTDFQRVSAFTGLPTVAGWWVHEWLWRGSADVVGKRIPDIVNIYESEDITLTKDLLKKYRVNYIIISEIEKKKYPNLNKNKFSKIGKLIFETSNKQGALYQVIN